MSRLPAEDHLEEMIRTYNELNASTIHEMSFKPSSVVFMQFVAKNKPFVVRKAAQQWEAVRHWTPSVLKGIIGHQKVKVAVTPNGYADAPTQVPGGPLVFAQPHEESQTVEEFLDYLTHQTYDRSSTGGLTEVRYAQAQNDNLRDEYLPLYTHVQRDIPFAHHALKRYPDAINLWIGNTHSVTAMHRDNYENIFVQITGRKYFWLLPPLCQPCVNEQPLENARYVRNGDGSLALRLDETGAETPFAIWDPENPTHNATVYSKLARPIRVTLEPGDMLYLPAMWYHKVSQSCGEGKIVISVNYWYDIDLDGCLYPLCSMVRNMTLRQPKSTKGTSGTEGDDRSVEGTIDGHP